MEPENLLPQHGNDGISDSDPSAQDQLNNRIDSISQWLTILGNKIGLNEQKLYGLQVEIDGISGRLAAIEKHLETIEEDVKARDVQLSGQDIHLLYVRASELENVWDKATAGVELEKIHILHGADIALDMQALNFLHGTDQQRYDVAKVGFENLYGIPFTKENERKITNAPSEIRKIIDKRTNLKFLRAWKWSSQAQHLVEMCNKILENWENEIEWFYSDSQLQQDYKELEKLFIKRGGDDDDEVEAMST